MHAFATLSLISAFLALAWRLKARDDAREDDADQMADRLTGETW